MPAVYFEDLVPAANRARGVTFDDLIPETNRTPNVGGRPASASPIDYAADSATVTANLAQPQSVTPSRPHPSMGQALLEAERNNLLAARQRTDPAVYDGDRPLRKKLGVVLPEVSDIGRVPPNSYINEQRQVVQVDPSKHVVLVDPASGQPTVFERNFDAEGTDVTEEPVWKSLGRVLMPGFVTGPVAGPARAASHLPPNTTPGASRVAEAAPAALAAQRSQNAADDLMSFERAQVPVFAPAFAGNAGRATAKGLAETWGVGAPVQKALEDTYSGMSAAATRLADDLSPVNTFDQAGVRLQHGLDRFRTAGVRDIEPGILTERGIDPRAPIQPQEVMSAGAQQRAAAAAPIRTANQGGVAETARGTQVPAARSLDQTILSRRSVDDITDAQIQTLTWAPAGETSFAVRAEALYESAQRQLPTQMRRDDTANPQLLQATNTRNTVNAMRAEQERSRIPGGVLNGRFGGLADRVQTNVTLPTLRSMRTAIGRELANFNYGEMGLDRTQLKALYASISRDIEIAYQDLANRAHIASRLASNAPNYVPPSTARAADRALYQFRRADRYFRQGMQRMDTFLNVVSANNPETAARRLVQAAMSGGKGDIALFRNAMAALRPEERADFGSLIIRQMGTPVPSARGIAQEVGFSPNSFATNYQKLDPRARAMLFPGQHGRALDDLFRVANRLSNVERFENVSGSGRMAVNVGGLMTGIGSSLAGGWPAVFGTAAGGLGLSYMLSRPAYARWLVRYMELKGASAQALDVSANGVRRGTRGIDAAVIAHVNKLGQAAQRDPELSGIYYSIATEEGVVERGDDQRRPKGDLRMQSGDRNPKNEPHGGNSTAVRPRAELRSYSPSPSESAALYAREGAEAIGIPALQAEQFGAGIGGAVSLFTPADDVADALQTGSAASAATAGLSFIPGFKGSKKAAEKALELARKELDEMEREASRLFSEGKVARIMGPSPVPAIPGRAVPDDVMLTATKDRAARLQKAIDDKRDELARRPQSRTSVPATTTAQQREVSRYIEDTPTIAIPGRQGFAPKDEQKRLVQQHFQGGGDLPPAPWGRTAHMAREDVKRILAEAHAAGRKVPDRAVSTIEDAARKADDAAEKLQELRAFSDAAPNRGDVQLLQRQLERAEKDATFWRAQYEKIKKQHFGD